MISASVRNLRIVAVVTILGWGLFCSWPAFATSHVTSKDTELFVKAVGFAKPSDGGPVKVAIVYNPQNEDSYKDAILASSLLNDYEGSGERFESKIIEMGRDASAPVAFIMTGAEKSAGRLTKQKVLTVALNPDCVISQDCVMAIVTEPKIDIYVSRKASELAGVQFGSAFLMMVKEY